MLGAFGLSLTRVSETNPIPAAAKILCKKFAFVACLDCTASATKSTLDERGAPRVGHRPCRVHNLRLRCPRGAHEEIWAPQARATPCTGLAEYPTLPHLTSASQGCSTRSVGSTASNVLSTGEMRHARLEGALFYKSQLRRRV